MTNVRSLFCQNILPFVIVSVENATVIIIIVPTIINTTIINYINYIIARMIFTTFPNVINIIVAIVSNLLLFNKSCVPWFIGYLLLNILNLLPEMLLLIL